MSETNHLIAPEELMAYLDGELSPDRTAAAAVHLQECRECQGIAADLQGVSRRLMHWQVEGLERLELAELSGALEERAKAKPERKKRMVWPWALGAAACVWLILFPPIQFRMSDKARMVADMARTRKPLSAERSTRVRREYAEDALAAAPAAKAKLPRASAGPMIVRTSRLIITTSQFDQVRDRITAILARHTGYFAELNFSATIGTARSLDATLRVPSEQLESTTSDLKALGRVESESQRGDDVAQDYIDLEARLTNAKNTEQRLTEMLRQRIGKLSDVLAVEKEIDDVRERIERMEAERKSMGNRVDFASVTLKVNEDYQAQMQVVPDSFLTRFRNAAVQGYQSLVESVVTTLVILLSYGPSILIWGAILFLPARFAWKKLRRASAR